MRAHRALALLATAGAMLVAVAGATLAGPGAASAAPGPRHPKPPAPGNPQAYPPPPPLLVVNRGTVKVGQSVHTFGNHFGFHEKVIIVVRFKPVHGSGGGGGFTTSTTTDRYGRFGLNLKLSVAGKAVITARGVTSHLSASVTVRVLGRMHAAPAAPQPKPLGTLSTYNPLVAQNGPPGLLAGGQAAGVNAGGDANLVANSKELTPGSGQFPMGAVGGVAALLGGTLLTLLALKRRRGEADS